MTTMDWVTQIGIMVFGCSAIWLVGRKEGWRKWGYLLGLLAQPCWFYTSITHGQWGIVALAFWYTYSWAQGVWNFVLQPWLAERRKAKAGPGKWMLRVNDEVYVWGEETITGIQLRELAGFPDDVAVFQKRSDGWDKIVLDSAVIELGLQPGSSRFYAQPIGGGYGPEIA